MLEAFLFQFMGYIPFLSHLFIHFLNCLSTSGSQGCFNQQTLNMSPFNSTSLNSSFIREVIDFHHLFSSIRPAPLIDLMSRSRTTVLKKKAMKVPLWTIRLLQMLTLFFPCLKNGCFKTWIIKTQFPIKGNLIGNCTNLVPSCLVLCAFEVLLQVAWSDVLYLMPHSWWEMNYCSQFTQVSSCE